MSAPLCGQPSQTTWPGEQLPSRYGLVTLSCLTLCHPTDCSPTRLLSPWYSPGKNPGVGFAVSFSVQKFLWVFLKHLTKSSELTFWPTPSRSWILGLSCLEAQRDFYELFCGVVCNWAISLLKAQHHSLHEPSSRRWKALGVSFSRCYRRSPPVYWTCFVLDAMIIFAYMKRFFKMKIWVFLISIHRFIRQIPVASGVYRGARDIWVLQDRTEMSSLSGRGRPVVKSWGLAESVCSGPLANAFRSPG